MEMMVEHVSINKKFKLVMSGYGISFIVCAMFSPTCRDIDTTLVIGVDDGQFSA